MTEERYTKCDGCERRVKPDQAAGWYQVAVTITSQEQLDSIHERITQTGNSGLLSGDFCSLLCLRDWAGNAIITAQMEAGLPEDPEEGPPARG